MQIWDSQSGGFDTQAEVIITYIRQLTRPPLTATFPVSPYVCGVRPGLAHTPQRFSRLRQIQYRAGSTARGYGKNPLLFYIVSRLPLLYGRPGLLSAAGRIEIKLPRTRAPLLYRGITGARLHGYLEQGTRSFSPVSPFHPHGMVIRVEWKDSEGRERWFERGRDYDAFAFGND